jgi:kynurenine formamidase
MRPAFAMCSIALVIIVSGGPGAVAGGDTQAPPGTDQRAATLSKAEFDRLFQQASNWGRWGKDDQRGTYNLLTPEKRRQATALVKSGISVSLEHTLIEEKAPDAPTPLQKLNHGNRLVWESVHGGAFHSHIDALCHYPYGDKLYNGFLKNDVDLEQGCVKLGLELYKDGFLTRGVLIDMPRLKGVPWLEPGTPVTVEDIQAWEKKSGIKVLPGDAVFLRTGRWARRAKLGSAGFGNGGDIMAGYHWSVIPWFKAHDVAIISDEGPNDVRPAFVDKEIGNLLPIHTAALAAMGAIIIDGQDLDAVAELAQRLNRWDFMMTAAPLAIAGGSGVSINVTATF